MAESNQDLEELRSTEYQEIVGKSPSWLLRSGLSILLGMVILLVFGSWLFHYPDIIEAPVELSSENPPSPVVARVSGHINRLFVTDKDTVVTGQILGVLESTASYNDVNLLKNKMVVLNRLFSEFDTTNFVNISPSYKLGTIQSEYSTFYKQYHQYQVFRRLNFYPQKIESLQKRHKMLEVYYNRLWTQRQILAKEYRISSDLYNRDSVLFLKNVLSLDDLKDAEAAMLEKKYDFTSARTQLADTKGTILSLEQDIITARNDYADEKQDLEGSLVESFHVLRSQLDEWWQNYVLIAPQNGIVSFSEFWSENQEVKEADIVCTVIPSGATRIIGRASLPVAGAGKVEVGQSVHIRFSDFPYMQFGTVEGTVQSVSLMPSDNNYIVEIRLPQVLETSYHVPLPFRQQMSGTAEIVTEDMRLIQRFFNPVKSIVHEKISD